MLKRAYLFPEEKRGHVRSPFFVQRILFPLCNATPVRLPPDINTDRHVTAPRATRLWGAMATVRVCSCHLPVSLLQAPPFPTLWEQELPAQPDLILPRPSQLFHPWSVPPLSVFASQIGEALLLPFILNLKKTTTNNKSFVLYAKNFGYAALALYLPRPFGFI